MAGTTETIQRTVVSTITQQQSKATFQGWTLVFNAQLDNQMVKSVSVHGNKEGSTVSASISEQGYINVGFNQGPGDSALISALMSELEAMKTPVTA